MNEVEFRNWLVNKGLNENMKSFPDVTFPIGKYYMGTYRHSLKLYVIFCEETLQ